MGYKTNHFAGGAHLAPDQGAGPHLGQILVAIKNDLASIAGIRGLANIAAADAAAIAASNASDEETLVTLANEVKATYNAVVAILNETKAKLDPLNQYVIATADAAATTIADATNLATANTLLNDIKTKYNLALTLANELKTDFTTSGDLSIAASDLTAEATANGTDQTTGNALANSLKTKVGAARTMAAEIKSEFNAIPKTTLSTLAL